MKGAQLETAVMKGDGEVLVHLLFHTGDPSSFDQCYQHHRLPTWCSTQEHSFPEQVLLLERLLKDTALKTTPMLQLMNKTFHSHL